MKLRWLPMTREQVTYGEIARGSVRVQVGDHRVYICQLQAWNENTGAFEAVEIAVPEGAPFNAA